MREGVAPSPEGSAGRTPENFMKRFGQNTAFWFVIDEKTCSCHGLLGLRNIALTPPLTLGLADP